MLFVFIATSRTKNICFMRRLPWECSKWDIKFKDLLLFMFFAILLLIPFVCRLCLPTVLQMVKVHSSFVHTPSCTIITPSPSVSSFYCLSCLLVRTLRAYGLLFRIFANPHTNVLLCRPMLSTQNLFSFLWCVLDVCLPWCPVTRIVSEP